MLLAIAWVPIYKKIEKIKANETFDVLLAKNIQVCYVVDLWDEGCQTYPISGSVIHTNKPVYNATEKVIFDNNSVKGNLADIDEN